MKSQSISILISLSLKIVRPYEFLLFNIERVA
jgi:hypothetical protein